MRVELSDKTFTHVYQTFHPCQLIEILEFEYRVQAVIQDFAFEQNFNKTLQKDSFSEFVLGMTYYKRRQK